MAVVCAAFKLVDCPAGRAGGQRGCRCKWSYGRKGALPAGAKGKNPPCKSAMGAACIGLLG